MKRSDQIAAATLLVTLIATLFQIVGQPHTSFQHFDTLIFWIPILVSACIAAILIGSRLRDRMRPLPPIRRLLVASYIKDFEVGLHTANVDRFFPQYRYDTTRHKTFWACNPESLIVFRDKASGEYEGSFFLAGLTHASSQRIVAGDLFPTDL